MSVAACAYHLDGPIEEHYQRYHARMPERDKVFVCSAYGCRTQTPFRFSEADIEHMRKMMADADKSAEDERGAVATTLAWVERRVGDEVGTSADRPADDMAGSGDPAQMDCVDIATNLTSYLLILERHKLLKRHTVGTLFVKEDLRRGFAGWPHYAAILIDNESGQRYAVDGWLLASGEPPEIVETEKWYIDDSSIVFSNKAAPAADQGIVTASTGPRDSK